MAECLAVGLGQVEDLRGAASVAGLSALSDAELRALEPEARRHSDLVEGRAAALSRLAHADLALALLRLREVIPVLGPGVVANTCLSLSKLLEALTGGAQRIFSEVTVMISEGHGADIDASEIESVCDHPQRVASVAP
jgi:hypothetical protein